MAGPTFRAATSGSGSGTTITVTAPAGLTDTDFILVVIAHASNSATVTPPAGWTSLVAAPGFGTNWTFWKAASGEGASWNFTLASDNYVWACAAASVAPASVAAIDLSSFGAGTGGTTIPAITTTKPNTFLFATCYTSNNFTAYTPPAALTELGDQGINPQPESWLGYRTANQAVAGDTGTFVFSVGDVAGYGLVAIYEATPAPSSGARPPSPAPQRSGIRAFRATPSGILGMPPPIVPPAPGAEIAYHKTAQMRGPRAFRATPAAFIPPPAISGVVIAGTFTKLGMRMVTPVATDATEFGPGGSITITNNGPGGSGRVMK